MTANKYRERTVEEYFKEIEPIEPSPYLKPMKVDFVPFKPRKKIRKKLSKKETKILLGKIECLASTLMSIGDMSTDQLKKCYEIYELEMEQRETTLLAKELKKRGKSIRKHVNKEQYSIIDFIKKEMQNEIM